MSHLNLDQLSALLDDALPSEARTAAEAHLAACEPCRDALAALRTQDAALDRSLRHDPGEAYFATFAARVASRIETAGAASPADARHAAPPVAAESEHGFSGHIAPVGAIPESESQARGKTREPAPWFDIGSWFRSPGRLVYVGGVAAVVVAAGVVLMIARESGVPELRDSQVAARTDQVGGARASGSGGAPAPGTLAESEADEAAGKKDGNETPALADQGRAAGDAAGQLAAPSRVQEMRRLPNGEDVPVTRGDVPSFAAPPQSEPRTPTAPGEPVQVVRQRRASPLGSAPSAADAQAAKPRAKEETAPAVGQDARRKEAKLEMQAPAPAARAPLAQQAGRSSEGVFRSSLPADSALDKTGANAISGAATVTLCGDVADASGRPLAGVQVALGDRGTTTRTNEAGHFCIEATEGRHTLIVMAVGFVPTRVEVAAPLDVERLIVRLQTADVLGSAQPGSTLGSSFAGGLQYLKVSDAPAVAESLLATRRLDARRLATLAERDPTAQRFDAAADAWDTVVKLGPAVPSNLDARYALANARYRAWQLEPTATRAAAARTAMREFIDRAGPDARRAGVEAWLRRLTP